MRLRLVLASLSLALCFLQQVQAAQWQQDAEQLRSINNPPGRKHGFVYTTSDEPSRLRFALGKVADSVDNLQAEGTVAEGSFSDLPEHKSNFGQLRITTHAGRDDALQLRAAGFLEGYLTAERLFDYVFNYNYWFQSKGNGTQAIKSWLIQQDVWLRAQVAAHHKSDDASMGASSSSVRNQAGVSASARGGGTNNGRGRGGDTAESRRQARRLEQATAGSGRQAGRDDHGAQPGGGSDGDAGGTSGQGLGEGFWYAVSLALQQLDGIREGYNARVSELGPDSGMSYMKPEALLLINAYGDLGDLMSMFVTGNDDEVTLDLSKLSPIDAWHRLQTSGHCSALIKVTGDLSDIMVGHTTWSTYYSMIRLYKHYDFSSLASPHARGKKTSFPSYPGTITSIDDFYILSPSNLVVLETTNNVYDKSLYAKVSYRSALSYHRVYAANLVAENGAQWTDMVQMYPSGTYNNQWMVVDLKRFKPGTELQPGLLTVIELLPGFTMSADATHELERGFWPSYNVPYFREVYNRAGYPAMAAALTAKGPDYAQVVGGLSYQLAPRAKIFRRDAGSVENLHDMTRVLRQGKWSNDTYSGNDVWGTICARGDLDPKKPKPYGCLDAKVTSYSLALQSASLAVSGPSAEEGLPPFSWGGAAAFAPGPHRGMPETYNGEIELQQP